MYIYIYIYIHRQKQLGKKLLVNFKPHYDIYTTKKIPRPTYTHTEEK